ncbi:MAG: calcium/proton exchanger [Acidobacteria bacterium]|nr:calcium/proton exchanger [Acidobacteriota bacterium]
MAETKSWASVLRWAVGGWRASILILLPGAVALEYMHQHPVLVFGVAALSLVPLASLLGEATEELAGHVGSGVGGFLNATLGNAAELIIAFLALRSGHTEVVKASITGSIIGNLLLVFGAAVLIGGMGREKQTFNRTAVGANTSMLFLAVVALVMPALFELAVFGKLEEHGEVIERLSFWTAAVLLVSYFASLIFTFRTHKDVFRGGGHLHVPQLGRATAIAVLVGATLLIVVASEILVSQLEFVTKSLGWTELFVGLVIVAIVGNAAEHSTAIMMARKDKMDLALNIAVGSSTQVALFVAPLLVVVSQLMPSHMSLVFHPLEIAAVIFSVGIVILIGQDGETNWFEGLQLLSVYAILAVFIFFLPGA